MDSFEDYQKDSIGSPIRPTSIDNALLNKRSRPLSVNNFLRLNPSSLFYEMTLQGSAIIFNHFKYLPDSSVTLTNRDGTQFDTDRLKTCLEKLNFNVEVYNDLTIAGIKDVISKVGCKSKSEISCLIVVILTHGMPGYLYAVDGKYEINLLWEGLTSKECPQLAGIPKLYFIQACRGEKLDSGYSMSDSILLPSVPNTGYKIPSMADFLHMYATYEDHSSWRKTDGSWFIQSLCEVFEEEASYWDLLQLLTFVNRKVAIEYETKSKDPNINGMKQIPQIKSMLTKLLKFKVVDDPEVINSKLY